MTTLHSYISENESILYSYPNSLHYGLPLCIVSFFVCYVVCSIVTALKPGLRSIPGPAIARFSSLYRPWKISKGDAGKFYLKLHEKYGAIVRTGPNTVDISDPKALPIIYGITSKFLKVAAPKPSENEK